MEQGTEQGLKQIGAEMLDVQKVVFDAVQRGLIRVDVTERDGQPLFHIHRAVELQCTRCGGICEDDFVSICPTCELPRSRMARTPKYEGPWGRDLTDRLKTVLEETFKDGILDWVPEADSWYFCPQHPVPDRTLAAKTVLDRLALE